MTPNRAALLILIGLAVLAYELRSCAPHPASGAPRSTVYVPFVGVRGRCDYRRDPWDCHMMTATARAAATPTPTRASATWAPGPYEPLGRVWLPVTGGDPDPAPWAPGWRWDIVAVVRADAGKPTAAPTPTRTGTPTPTRPPRATRTPRATGTPTQGRMLPVPTCGAGTLAPGPMTPHPPCCCPYGAPFTATPDATVTPTASDTPPASATWEPTPTPALRVEPVAGGVMTAGPERRLYHFPMVIVGVKVKR